MQTLQRSAELQMARWLVCGVAGIRASYGQLHSAQLAAAAARVGALLLPRPGSSPAPVTTPGGRGWQRWLVRREARALGL